MPGPGRTSGSCRSATGWPAGLPHLDYWLFDSRTLVVFRYDAAGRLTTAEVTDQAAPLAQARTWRDIALRDAIPCDQYMARRQLQRAS